MTIRIKPSIDCIAGDTAFISVLPTGQREWGGGGGRHDKIFKIYYFKGLNETSLIQKSNKRENLDYLLYTYHVAATEIYTEPHRT